MPRPPASAPPSRDRLLAAAIVEFAARGFAGANVDRIARRARVNKAMIYYHFTSKAALYRAIIREVFGAVGDRVRAIAESDVEPETRVRDVIDIVVRLAEERPYFPPIMLRELAERGRRLDRETLRLVSDVPRAFAAIVQAGVASGRFAPVHPLLLYFTILGTVVFFFVSAPVRGEMKRLGVADLDVDRDALVAHVQAVALRLLRPGGASRACTAHAGTKQPTSRTNPAGLRVTRP